STVAESGGVYTLSGVPAGEVRVAVTFTGLDTAEAAVKVQPGRTAVLDFTMTDSADRIVKLDAFRVETEREGNARAIQEQKAALEIKSVVSTDVFGEITTGNVGEFLNFMPGVQIDYQDADARSVSIGGLDPRYSIVMIDGAQVAGAGSANLGNRALQFEQLSISSIETVELSKTPTPDVAGSALAGIINLRSKGAFDRKGRQVRWSTSAALNSHQMTLKKTPGPADRKTYKLQPNASLQFSDVFLDGKLGVLAGFNYAKTFNEQNITSYTYAFDTDRTNNATEVPRLSAVQIIDSPKVDTRTNGNLRLDYKLSPDLMVWARGEWNDYEARNFHHNVTLNFANAINGPAPTDLRVDGVEYSLKSQTTTLGSAQQHFNLSFNKHGATVNLAAGLAFKRGAFRADAQVLKSRSVTFYHDVDYGFVNAGTTGLLSGLGLRWDRSNAGDAGINITQSTGPDWRDLASYTAAPAPTIRRQPFKSKEQRWTAKADFRYDWTRGEMPVLLKWGGSIEELIRNVDRGGIFPYTYLGPDGLAGTGDERWTTDPVYRQSNLAGGNIQGIPALDRFAMAREYGAHPERFVGPTPQQLLTDRLRTHWDVKEQIDSLYQQTIFKVTKKFSLAPGVRMEKTRSAGRGPTDRGDEYAKRELTGDPNADIPTTSLDYIQARYGSDAVNSSDYHTWLKYLHATYRLTSDLVLRASFNDSITRPQPNNLAGGMTVNPDSIPPTTTISNPDLQPEHGRNIFASAEYYFPKGAGFFSISAARRDISNLIAGNTFDVPADSDYLGLGLGGYRVSTTHNVGKAHVGSLEFSYRQNMVFLPGMWQRLSIFGNYTVLK
ncbi:MAG: TonB-dependent receptor domain-containing protein, partial [Opitutaceae bacterium]